MKLPPTRILIVAVVLLAILFVIGLSKRLEGFEGGADTFTMYYADWCPHCNDIKPVFKDYSKSGSVTVKGKTVFMSMVEEKKIKSDVKVNGYPTFVLQKADGTTIESDAERTPDGWTQWLEKNV